MMTESSRDEFRNRKSSAVSEGRRGESFPSSSQYSNLHHADRTGRCVWSIIGSPLTSGPGTTSTGVWTDQAAAHYWGREILKLGHDVRLVPPIYVKPFVKRQKNDAADAEAICEAAQRPTMRFVEVKGEEQQARAMLFHTRDLLVRQRTQTNALRGHLAEFGVVAPQGVAHVGRLASALEDPGSGLPGAVRALGGVLLGQIAGLDAKIGGLEKEFRACARQDEQAARLMTIPGIGPINAMALQAFAPPMENFRRGRDFSAWLGLVPRQHTTGGKPRLGRISKMGQRDLRRLLIIGAMAVVSSAVRRGETNDPWLARMLERKPRMLVAVALANRMAIFSMPGRTRSNPCPTERWTVPRILGVCRGRGRRPWGCGSGCARCCPVPRRHWRWAGCRCPAEAGGKAAVRHAPDSHLRGPGATGIAAARGRAALPAAALGRFLTENDGFVLTDTAGALHVLVLGTRGDELWLLDNEGRIADTGHLVAAAGGAEIAIHYERLPVRPRYPVGQALPFLPTGERFGAMRLTDRLAASGEAVVLPVPGRGETVVRFHGDGTLIAEGGVAGEVPGTWRWSRGQLVVTLAGSEGEGRYPWRALAGELGRVAQ